jgi:uncharacterized membrane protein YczE
MDKFYLSNRDPLAYIQIMIGLFIFAGGIVSLLKSNLGMGPWSVFHVGITNHIPLTLGRVSQAVGLLIIVGSLFLNIYPGVGTILNMISVGFFIDLINPYIPFMDELLYQMGFVGLGIVFMGLGSGLYINANLGAGPRDGLMLGLHKKTGRSIRFIRNSMEITVLIVGFFLGGPVGVGTVGFALAIGPSVQFFLKLIPERGNESQPSGKSR